MQPETELSGVYEEYTRHADVDSLLDEIDAVKAEELDRLERLREAALAGLWGVGAPVGGQNPIHSKLRSSTMDSTGVTV